MPRRVTALPRSLGDPLLRLQRVAGNRAVLSAVADAARARERTADRVADAVVTGRPWHLNGAATAVPPASPVRRRLGSGRQLPTQVRAELEPRLGRPLDAVRVHTGPSAAATADALGVQAFSSGSAIVFGTGRYAPDTRSGRWLLVHELVHATSTPTHPSPPRLTAYESPEHRYFGDEGARHLRAYLLTEEGRAWARSLALDARRIVAQIESDPFAMTGQKIRVREDLALTPGEVIALAGDLYRGPEAIQRADPDEVRELLNIVERQERHDLTGTEANIAYETATSGRYTRLAKRNAPHFAPANRSAWQTHHESAMALARVPSSDADLHRAYLIDASGAHYLTDAFASGHLIDVQRVEPAIESHLRRHPIDVRDNPEMATILYALHVSGDTVKLVLKNIHDRLNRDGFRVTNAKGMSWTTYGDDHLDEASETRMLASLAVFLSRRQVTAARDGERPDPQDVLDLLPDEASVERATRRAIALIPEEARNVMPLIHRNTGMLRTLDVPVPILGPLIPYVAESLVRTISSPGRRRQLERAQETGTVPPQFTIAEW